MIAGEIAAKIGADIGPLERGIAEGERKLGNFGRGVRLPELDRMMGGLGEKMKSLTDGLGTAGLALTGAFTAPLAAVTKLAFGFDALREQAKIAFTTLLGSAQEADGFLKQLADFAARTPFEFPDL